MSSTGELASMILHELLDAVPVLDCKYEELAPGVMLLVDVLLREYCSDENVAARHAGLDEDLKVMNGELLAAGLTAHVQKRHGGTADDESDDEEAGFFGGSSMSCSAVALGALADSGKTQGGEVRRGGKVVAAADMERAEQWLKRRAELAGMSSTAELASKILREDLYAVPILACKYEELLPGVQQLVDVLLREYCSDKNVAARHAGLDEDLKVMNGELLAAGLTAHVQKRHGGTADDESDDEDVGYFMDSGAQSIGDDEQAAGSKAAAYPGGC